MKKALYVAGILLGLGAIAWMLGGDEAWKTWRATASPAQTTVILIVVDTLRADHACDPRRMPNLHALALEGALSCEAIAPGSWTVPSHASFFTGTAVPAHGTHFVSSGTEIRKLSIRPLPEELETLAEVFASRGYQTAGLSGNPVLQPASGLSRGFESWRVPDQFGPWYGEAFIGQLRELLREDLEPDRPLFLFLNIADAHDPWFGVPEDNGLGLDSHDEVRAYFRVDEDGEVLRGDWARYVLGEMSSEEETQLRTEVADQYAWAVHQADSTLGMALDTLDAHGWLGDRRIVVVSDSGEFLGEHQLLRHGRYLYDENQAVPLLVVGSEVAFPEGPVSALAAHGLVLDGSLREFPVEASAYPDPAWIEFSEGALGQSTSAAIWQAGGKQLWRDGRVEAGAMDEELEDLVRRTTASAEGDGLMDPELQKALEAAGYL